MDLSPTLDLMCTRRRSPLPWRMRSVGRGSTVGRFCQSSRRCAQDGRAARATGAAVEVLLRSWTLRLWPASVSNRAWARLHGGCAVAGPDQSGGSDQNGPARCCDVGEATPRRRTDRSLGSRRRPRSHARLGAIACNGDEGAVQGAPTPWWISPATREDLFRRSDLDPSLSTLVDDGAL